MMLQPRQSRQRAFSFHSVSENDPTKRLRQISMQSINNFSLRRLLGSDPSGTSSSPQSFQLLSKGSREDHSTASKPMFHLVSKDTEENRPTSAGSSVKPISQPSEKSPEDPKDIKPGDPDLLSLNESSAEPSIPTFNLELSPSIEKLSDTLPSSSILQPSPTITTGIFQRLLFTNTLHPPPQTIGNRAPSVLYQDPAKENQSPRVSEKENIQRGSASFPVPPGPSSAPQMPANFGTLRLVIPDRHSSLSPPQSTPPLSSANKINCLPVHPLSPTSTSHSSRVTSVPTNPLSPTSPSSRAAHSFGQARPFLTLNLPTPTPPLTHSHYACYQSHRHMHFSPNVHNPVPCVACGAEEGQSRWKCYWCCLRVCDACMEVLGCIEGRELSVLMDRLEKGRAGIGRVEGPKEIVRRGWRVDHVVTSSGDGEDLAAERKSEEGKDDVRKLLVKNEGDGWIEVCWMKNSFWWGQFLCDVAFTRIWDMHIFEESELAVSSNRWEGSFLQCYEINTI